MERDEHAWLRVLLQHGARNLCRLQTNRLRCQSVAKMLLVLLFIVLVNLYVFQQYVNGMKNSFVYSSFNSPLSLISTLFL